MIFTHFSLFSYGMLIFFLIMILFWYLPNNYVFFNWFYLFIYRIDRRAIETCLVQTSKWLYSGCTLFKNSSMNSVKSNKNFVPGGTLTWYIISLWFSFSNNICQGHFEFSPTGTLREQEPKRRNKTTQRGVLPIMAYTGRLRPKGLPFSGFRYVYKRVGKSIIYVFKRAFN